MKYKNKSLILIVIILLPLILTSCFDSEQLNERMLVQAVGIDLVDGEIEVTLQVYAPATQGGSGISATADNAKIVTAKGETLTQAIQNATITQGKTVFMGHNRVIILGNDLAKAGILTTLDYFSSNASSRHNINIVIANEKASDILTTKINQGIVPAETIEKMITRANEIGLLKNVKLYELLSTLSNDYESATLPILEIIKDDEETQTVSTNSNEEKTKEESSQSQQSQENELDTISNIKVKGTGIIIDGKLENELNLEESQGLLFILNEVKDTTLTVKTDDFKTSAVQIYKSTSKMIPSVENGIINFKLEITSQATLGQKELFDGKVIDEISLNKLAEETGKIIENECIQAYQKAVQESKADIFELGNLIWKHNPSIWKNVKVNWKNAVKDITFTVETDIVINRVGLEL